MENNFRWYEDDDDDDDDGRTGTGGGVESLANGHKTGEVVRL
jgi:hypothetical protein